jgi:hypothetical protein
MKGKLRAVGFNELLDRPLDCSHASYTKAFPKFRHRDFSFKGFIDKNNPTAYVNLPNKFPA